MKTRTPLDHSYVDFHFLKGKKRESVDEVNRWKDVEDEVYLDHIPLVKTIIIIRHMIPKF